MLEMTCYYFPRQQTLEGCPPQKPILKHEFRGFFYDQSLLQPPQASSRSIGDY